MKNDDILLKARDYGFHGNEQQLLCMLFRLDVYAIRCIAQNKGLETAISQSEDLNFWRSGTDEIKEFKREYLRKYKTSLVVLLRNEEIRDFRKIFINAIQIHLFCTLAEGVPPEQWNDRLAELNNLYHQNWHREERRKSLRRVLLDTQEFSEYIGSTEQNILREAVPDMKIVEQRLWEMVNERAAKVGALLPVRTTEHSQEVSENHSVSENPKGSAENSAILSKARHYNFIGNEQDLLCMLLRLEVYSIRCIALGNDLETAVSQPEHLKFWGRNGRAADFKREYLADNRECLYELLQGKKIHQFEMAFANATWIHLLCAIADEVPVERWASGLAELNSVYRSDWLSAQREDAIHTVLEEMQSVPGYIGSMERDILRKARSDMEIVEQYLWEVSYDVAVQEDALLIEWCADSAEENPEDNLAEENPENNLKDVPTAEQENNPEVEQITVPETPPANIQTDSLTESSQDQQAESTRTEAEDHSEQAQADTKSSVKLDRESSDRDNRKDQTEDLPEKSDEGTWDEPDNSSLSQLSQISEDFSQRGGRFTGKRRLSKSEKVERDETWGCPALNFEALEGKVRFICFLESCVHRGIGQSETWLDCLKACWPEFYPNHSMDDAVQERLSRLTGLWLPGKKTDRKKRIDHRTEFMRYCRTIGIVLTDGGNNPEILDVSLNQLLVAQAVLMTIAYTKFEQLNTRSDEAFLADFQDYIGDRTYVSMERENHIIAEFKSFFLNSNSDRFEQSTVLLLQKYRSILRENFKATRELLSQRSRNIRQVAYYSERVGELEDSLANADLNVKRNIVLRLDRGSYGCRLGEMYRLAQGLDQKDPGQVRDLLGHVFQLLDSLGISPTGGERLDEHIPETDEMYSHIVPEGDLNRDGRRILLYPGWTVWDVEVVPPVYTVERKKT